jgi:hypothetical protein
MSQSSNLCGDEPILIWSVKQTVDIGTNAAYFLAPSGLYASGRRI